MDFSKVVKSRKSIRSYEPKPLSKKILSNLVEDGAKAPSSQNNQPWKFYVVVSKKQRDLISKIISKSLILYKKDLKSLPKKTKEEALEFYKDMGNCQNFIFVFTSKEKSQYRLESKIMGISAAVENIMLSAVNKGLGTCWVGGFRGFQKEIKKVLRVSSNKVLIAGFLIGYPKKGYKPLIRKKKKLKEILKFI